MRQRQQQAGLPVATGSDVIAAANIEMSSLKPRMTNAAGDREPETGQQAPAFSDSLIVASKVSSNTERPVGSDAAKAGHGRKWDDAGAKISSVVHEADTSLSAAIVAQIVPPPILPSQMPLPQPGGTESTSGNDAAASQPMQNFGGSLLGAGLSVALAAGRELLDSPSGAARVVSSLASAPVGAVTPLPQAAGDAITIAPVTNFQGSTPATRLGSPARVTDALHPQAFDFTAGVTAQALPVPSEVTARGNMPASVPSGSGGTPPGAASNSHAQNIPGDTANAAGAQSTNIEPVQSLLPTPDPNAAAAIPFVPTVTADPLTSWMGAARAPLAPSGTGMQAGSGKPAMGAAVHGKNGSKDISKDGPKDGVNGKQPGKYPPLTTDAANSTTGEQGQRDNSSQSQNTSPASLIGNHGTVADDRAQAAPALVVPQTVTHATVVEGQTARMTDVVLPAAVPVAQPLSAINTAKLIQGLGQSEMRVGMRSAEFGNISIRTSATPDLLSAQISLDHSDLAKVLSTHLPEIQAKLSGSQSANVQINMSDQNTGASGGSSNGSAEESRRSRQQPDGQSQTTVHTKAEASRYSPAVIAMTGGATHQRLDVRA